MPAAAVFAPGSTALITGAASGIGLAIAKLSKSKGMNVFLVDRNADALDEAEAELKNSDGPDTVVGTAVVDVSQLDQWKSLREAVAAKLGSVELLVLNAGIGMKGGWGDSGYFRMTLETNLFGVINGVNTFLPVVQEAAKSKPTAIVMTGSKQGITNPPGNPAYNASKAAIKSLAEQLSWELKDETSVHLLVPGWTFTGLTGQGQAKEKPAGAWSAEQVADYMYSKMEEDQFYIICPDHDVSETTDKKRMLWSIGDVTNGRPPMSRWREEWKKQAEDGMAKMDV